MKLKHFFIFLLASLLFASCSDSDDNNEPRFENIVDQGSDGKDIKWVLQEDGTLTVYGKGEMQDYSIDSWTVFNKSPWYPYLDEYVKKIIIRNSITSIGKGAFFGCQSLIELTIPNSVTTIGEGAFIGCRSLVELNIPHSVTTIGRGAFSICQSLTKLEIPNSVTSIGEGAFMDCYHLKELTLSKSIVSISKDTFFGSRNLIKLEIPNSVTSIGENAFSVCHSLVKLTIPDSVTSIGSGAFASCESLKYVTIPRSVMSIGIRAFHNSNIVEKIYSYCPMSAYPLEELAFSTDRSTEATMYVTASNLQDYKAVQNTYWDHMNITISDTPAP